MAGCAGPVQASLGQEALHAEADAGGRGTAPARAARLDAREVRAAGLTNPRTNFPEIA